MGRFTTAVTGSRSTTTRTSGGNAAPVDGAQWGALADGSRVALPAGLGPLRLHARRDVPPRDGVPHPAGRGGVPPGFLVEHPEEDWLVTAPSISPENTYVTDDGQAAAVTYAPTMDVRFHSMTASSTASPPREVLDIRGVPRWPGRRRRAPPPMQVGEHGQLQEWIEDYDEADPGHRHISHLYGAHPSDRITPRETPELADAVRTSLERRLEHGGATPAGAPRGWSISSPAWKTASEPTSGSRRCSRSRRRRTCSASTRRSRSTGTSAPPQASSRCCWAVTATRSASCRRSPTRGPRVGLGTSAPGAISRSTLSGRAGV